jgi:hypothetical protein
MQIENLTREQELLIPQIHDYWLLLASNPLPDRDKASAVIKDLYEFAGHQVPKMVLVDSPLSGVLAIEILKNGSSLDSSLHSSLDSSLDSSLHSSLDSSLRSSLHSSLRSSLDSSLRSSLDSSLHLSLRSSLDSSLDSSLRSSLHSSLRSSLDSSLRSSLDSSLHLSLRSSLDSSLHSSLDSSLHLSLHLSLRSSLRSSLHSSLGSEFYIPMAAFVDISDRIGVKFDREKYELYKSYCEHVGWIFPFQNICIACDRPTVKWRDGVIHSDNSPAVEFKDGFKIWAIGGVIVDEQIVMSPQTQAIKQINNEKNQEIKRIRIERFGWREYLEAVNANVLDVSINNIWMESLMQSQDMKILCTYDPSTGRIYALEVDPSCQTCEQAQRYLLAPDIAFSGCGVDTNSITSYPKYRA